MRDIQNDALASTQASAKGKGKRKAAAVESDDSDDDSDAMHLDGPLSDSNAGENSDSDDMNLGEDAPPVPMPASGGIQELREKLHARMAELKQKGRGGVGSGEPGSRDELLEERRREEFGSPRASASSNSEGVAITHDWALPVASNKQAHIGFFQVIISLQGRH